MKEDGLDDFWLIYYKKNFKYENCEIDGLVVWFFKLHTRIIFIWSKP